MTINKILKQQLNWSVRIYTIRYWVWSRVWLRSSVIRGFVSSGSQCCQFGIHRIQTHMVCHHSSHEGGMEVGHWGPLVFVCLFICKYVCLLISLYLFVYLSVCSRLYVSFADCTKSVRHMASHWSNVRVCLGWGWSQAWNQVRFRASSLRTHS